MTLGQEVSITSTVDMLFMQLTGGAFPPALALEQKQSMLQHYLKKVNALVVIDDVWEIEHTKIFSIVDDTTASKLLVSSRVRSTLDMDGSAVVHIKAPTEAEAIAMYVQG